MIFENITENAVLNAVGRLVDPGGRTTMPVEYYSSNKSFIDQYVADKKAKIEGMDEYKSFIANGAKAEEKVPEPKVDLMEEVLKEEEEAKPEKAEKVKAEPKKEEPKVEVKEEVKPAEKKTPTRRKRGGPAAAK